MRRPDTALHLRALVHERSHLARLPATWPRDGVTDTLSVRSRHDGRDARKKYVT